MRRKPATLMIAAAMVLAITAALFLSIGIDSLTLRSGSAQSMQSGATSAGSAGTDSTQNDLVHILRIVWAVLAVVILLCLLFWPTFRRLLFRYILAQLAYFAVLFVLAALVFATMNNDRQQPAGPDHLADTLQAAVGAPGTSLLADPPDVSIAQPRSTAEIPLWQIGLIAAAVVGIFLSFVFAAMYASRKIRSPSSSVVRSSLRDIATEAGQAVNRLQAGEDPASVILECYRRMIALVADRSGIENRSSLTPREFAKRLSVRNMDTDPIVRLTTIFEQVRYGERQAAPYREEALACFAAVRDAYATAV